ncbi:MAG: hypothetical protein ABIH49_02975 [archaeon]
MEKKNIAGLFSIISFAGVLFTPSDSNIWIIFLILGVLFGVVWFMGNRQ